MSTFTHRLKQDTKMYLFSLLLESGAYLQVLGGNTNTHTKTQMNKNQQLTVFSEWMGAYDTLVSIKRTSRLVRMTKTDPGEHILRALWI